MRMYKDLILCSVLLAVVPLAPCRGSSQTIRSAMPVFSPIYDLSTDAVMQRLTEGSDGKTPTVKQFDRDWVASLFERGEPTVYSAEDFDYIGMPIGGLTSGQLYLGWRIALCSNFLSRQSLESARGYA